MLFASSAVGGKSGDEISRIGLCVESGAAVEPSCTSLKVGFGPLLQSSGRNQDGIAVVPPHFQVDLSFFNKSGSRFL